MSRPATGTAGHAKGRRRHAARPPLRDDEGGVLLVVEAVLVAVIILTAILFYTSVQKPIRGGEQGSVNLGRAAADYLDILRSHDFLDPAGSGDLVDLPAWVTRVMAGDEDMAEEVDSFLQQLVPSGARYVVRLNNGVDSMVLLPYAGTGTPAGAQAAETPLFEVWRMNADPVLTDGATDAGDPTLTSDGGGFTAADIGKPIAGDGIPDCTFIVDAPTATTVTMSQDAQATATGADFTIAQRWRTAADAVTTGTTLTSLTAGFSAADIGKRVTGPGIAPCATIVAITSGTVVELSAAVTGPTGIIWIEPPAAMPGQQVPGGPLLTLTQAGSVRCIRAPMPDHATPTVGASASPADVPWATRWQGQPAGEERVPADIPYGMWAGYPNADCTGTPVYARVALPQADGPDDLPIYGLQLVIWYGA